MSFFDEMRAEYGACVDKAYAIKQRADMKAAMLHSQACDAVVEALRGTPEYVPFVDCDVSAEGGRAGIEVTILSPCGKAELQMWDVEAEVVSLGLSAEPNGYQFHMALSFEEATTMFVAWINGKRDVVTSHPECPHDWAETIGVES